MAEQKIGRFEIVRELGKGGQGAVYLARDTQLDRLVAIKTLRSMGRDTEHLLHEARISSKLQHPNIIPLYDAGEHQGRPYLVYAYIEGQTLAQKIRRQKVLSLVEAATIACGVLEGLSYAHRQGVMHLDVKPSNVMLNASGLPMVMDFGLAQAIKGQGFSVTQAIDGTPHYMAPERISGKLVDALADIYSVGVMLYEMVTGELVADGESVYAVLNRAVHEKVVAPSERNERVDEKLEAIILKAIAKNPAERFPDAAAMRQALQAYLGDVGEAGGGASAKAGAQNSTLEFLLRRMRSQSDFPALSNVISEINRIVSSDSESASKLARAILQDFALTNKVLRLVNSVSYGQFGGGINTISKAVMIMGFETIRNVAMSLIMLEFMKNKAQSAQIKDEVVAAVFSGIIAAQLSVGKNIHDAEEVMVCSMFHNFGRLLATFYFFEESQAVARLVEQGMSEESAATRVLGIPYSELGSGVAKSWNFSPRMLAGMRKLPEGDVCAPQGEMMQLTMVVNMANELCAVAATTSVEKKEQALRALSERYRGALKVSVQEMGVALNTGMGEMSRRSAVMGISPGKSALLKKVRAWSEYDPEAEREKHEKAQTQVEIASPDRVVAQQAEGKEDESAARNPEEILGAGIQDVTTSLVGDFKLSDLLLMVLETMYRGMGFNRALIMIRDNRLNMMVGRFGFGAKIESELAHFRFAISPSATDVFQLSIEKGADILIENTQASNIADKVPAWYRSSADAPCFLLLPVMVKDKAIALFYADMLKADGLNISKQQLSLLRTLRNQALLAIKQKL